MKYRITYGITLILAMIALTACTQTLPVACTQDAKICPDGSAVGRVAPACDFAPCPESEVEEPIPQVNSGSTFKEYRVEDAKQCQAIRFTCEGDEYFSDETGCGCIRNHNEAAVTLCSADYNPVCGWSGPEIQCFAYPCAQTYSNICMASIDPSVSYTTPGECPEPGSNPAAGETKLQAIDCPAERTQACTKEYVPVCGQKVLNTGEEATQTYGNKCEACADMKVISYFEGACESDEDLAKV